MHAEIAPLEESLKAMLVDIVRRCQSTVAQNYSRIQTTPATERPVANNEPSAAASSFDVEQMTSDTLGMTSQHPQSTEQSSSYAIDDTTRLFGEPPHLNLDELESLPNIDFGSSHNNMSDSGYSSFWSGPYIPFCICFDQDEDSSGKSWKGERQYDSSNTLRSQQ